MKVVHVNTIIRAVPALFSAQYADYPKDHMFPVSSGPGPRTVGEIEAALKAAGDDPAAILAVLPTWCEQTCDECGQGFDQLVRLGEEPDYEARWQELCTGCLSDALRLLLNAPAENGANSPSEASAGKDSA